MRRSKSTRLLGLTVRLLISVFAVVLFAARLTSALQLNAVAVWAVQCGARSTALHGQFDSEGGGETSQALLPARYPMTPQYVPLVMSCMYHSENWDGLIQLGKAYGTHDAVEAFFVGEAHRQTGEMEQALKLWRAFPQIASYFRWMCTDRLNASDCEAALDACQLATGINPNYGEACAELGRVHTYCTRRLDEALIAYRRAIDLGGDSPTMWMAMAHTLNMQGRFAEASQTVDEHQLTGALADLIRGDALRTQDRLNEALQMYQRALAQNDRDPWIYHELAMTYQALGKNSEAVQAWNLALQIDPNFGPALDGIAAIQKNQ